MTKQEKTWRQGKRMLLGGGTGFIGKALAQALRGNGWEVLILSRRKNERKKDFMFWDPERGIFPESSLNEFDAVINLAGENIAGRRWSAQQKRRILSSRIYPVQLLVAKIAEADPPPTVFLSASAIGFYGNHGQEPVDEAAEHGRGFLSEVCQKWEEEAARASSSRTRVVHARFAPVIGRGGMLSPLLPLFRRGLGATVGNGKQMFSWVALDDAVSAIELCLEREELAGPINISSPFPVPNSEFAYQLASCFHSHVNFTVPAPIINLLMGEMGRELLLASVAAYPRVLTDAGFAFTYPELKMALAHYVGRDSNA